MTKLEEIAIAIRESLSEGGPNSPTRGDFYMAAAAAVEAMKVPNRAMLDAPYKAAPPELRPGSHHFWESMINAILNEKPHE